MNKSSDKAEVIKLLYNKGYRITEDGLMLNDKGKIIEGNISQYGYKNFNTRAFGRYFRIEFHRFQAYQKFGDDVFNEDLVVRHINNNKLDNSWDNIELGTCVDNYHDSEDKFHEIAKQNGKERRKYDYQEIIKLKELGKNLSIIS